MKEFERHHGDSFQLGWDEKTIPFALLSILPHEGIHGQPLLSGLLVDSIRRRQGYATDLIYKAERLLEREGFSRVFAVVHPENMATRKLFQKLGYTEMILMEKQWKPLDIRQPRLAEWIRI